MRLKSGINFRIKALKFLFINFSISCEFFKRGSVNLRELINLIETNASQIYARLSYDKGTLKPR